MVSGQIEREYVGDMWKTHRGEAITEAFGSLRDSSKFRDPVFRLFMPSGGDSVDGLLRRNSWSEGSHRSYTSEMTWL